MTRSPEWNHLVPELAAQAIDFAVILVDPGGTIRDWNTGAERVLGYPPEEIIGLPIDTIFTDEDRRDGVPARELATAEREGRAEDTRWHRRRDGSHVWVTGATTTIHDPAGRLLAFGKIVRDATERRDAETRLRAIIESAMDAIVSVDDSERIVVFNQAAERIFGIAAADAIGEPLDRFIPPRYRDIHHAHFRQFAATGATTRSLHALSPVLALRADGTEFPIEATLSTIVIGGRRLHTVIIRDVSQRLASEAELRASEARFRAIVTNVGRGVALLTRAGEFLMANDQLADMVGDTAARLVGRNLSEFVAVDDPAQTAEVEAVLAATQPRTVELRCRRRDGAEILVRMTASVVPSPGREPGVVVMTEDITESRRIEEAMRHTQRLEAVGVLAAGIAHDFNNLLTAIIGNLSLGLRAAPAGDTAELSPMLREALRASEQAAELVRQLLAYAGKQRVAAGPVDLCRIVEEVARLLRASIPRQVELRFDLPSPCPPIEGDTGQLQQVTMNLVLNAAEAIGDEPGVVTVRAAREEWTRGELAAAFPEWGLDAGTYLRFEVHDTGAGMDAATLGRIFDPFFTTKFLGRGLGLSAVHGIVRGHRGGLTVQSEPGAGSTFRVLLPVSSRPAAAPVEQPPDARERPAVNGTIAVVDDEPAVRRVAARALERSGYTIVTAADGREAIELVARRGADLALMLLDLAMPNMSGAEAVPLIRQHRPDLPLVLMTGYGDDATRSRVEQLGVAAIIQKPFTAEQLVEQVQEVLARAR